MSYSNNNYALLSQGVCHINEALYDSALHNYLQYITCKYSTLYNTTVGSCTVYRGDMTGQRIAGGRLAGQPQCENFPLAILTAVPLTDSKLRESLQFIRSYAS